MINSWSGQKVRIEYSPFYWANDPRSFYLLSNLFTYPQVIERQIVDVRLSVVGLSSGSFLDGCPDRQTYLVLSPVFSILLFSRSGQPCLAQHVLNGLSIIFYIMNPQIFRSFYDKALNTFYQWACEFWEVIPSFNFLSSACTFLYSLRIEVFCDLVFSKSILIILDCTYRGTS